MSWLIFKKNILESMITGRFTTDTEGFADFYANEYDQCIKRGGDNIYGVPAVNGSVTGMADVIKNAMKKGQESDGENFNILEEIYPAAFDAYWLGSEMAPIPNPLLKPLGWPSTLPATGTIQNIGPNPIAITSSITANKAKEKALQILEDELKKQIITIPGIGPVAELTIPVYDTAMKIINKELATPEDEKSKQFYNELRNYFTRPSASKADRAKWDAFVQLNQEYGYAPVAIRNRTIAGKRSMINPLSGRLNLVMVDNPKSGEIKPRAELLLDEYMAEYGHYIQYNKNPDASKLSKATRFLGDLAGDYGNMIKNADSLNLKDAYTTNYKTPGTVEYEAHEVIQKKLQSDFDRNVEKSIISNITELTTGQNQMELDSIIRNNPIIKNAIDIIKKLKEAKKKKPAIGSQIKKAIKFPFPKLPSKKKLVEEAKEKLIEQAIEEIKKQIIPPIEEIILQPFVVPIVNAIELAKNSIPKPLPTKEQVVKYVKDTAEGLIPEIDLSLYISIPKIPNIKEIKKQIEEKMPTEEELRDLAEQIILDRLPNIPNIWFTLPSYVFTYPTNVFADPFVNLAKFHLMGTSGNMSVLAQYTPPAPPAPAILNWTGYKVIG